MEDKNGAPSLKRDLSHLPAKSGWLVSPAFDLFFLANLWWLLAFIPGFINPEGTPHLQFWQLYFLTTPHRWITLGLVTLDPDRREGRTRLFIGLAVFAFVVVWTVRWWQGAFQCLML